MSGTTKLIQTGALGVLPEVPVTEDVAPAPVPPAPTPETVQARMLAIGDVWFGATIIDMVVSRQYPYNMEVTVRDDNGVTSVMTWPQQRWMRVTRPA